MAEPRSDKNITTSVTSVHVDDMKKEARRILERAIKEDAPFAVVALFATGVPDNVDCQAASTQGDGKVVNGTLQLARVLLHMSRALSK